MSAEGPPPLLVGLRIEGWRCLVVGGGEVAARRVRRLLESGAEVTVVAPEIVPGVARSIDRAALTWHARPYQRGDVEDMALVVCATGDDEVDAMVRADAVAAGSLVNDATDAAQGTVIFPAVAREGQVSIAVTTGGGSPSLSRWLAARLAGTPLPDVSAATELMASVRREVLAAGRPSAHPGWAAALDAGLVDLVAAGSVEEARDLLRRHLELDEPSSP